jgi:hypothetical protein
MLKHRIRGLAIAACLVATSARAQGPPPFALDAPGSASQRVDIEASVEQDDGTHKIEIYPVLPDGGEQTRGQSGAGSEHGRLWTVPGSTSYAILPNGGGGVSSAPLPEGYGTRSFLVFEDPITTPGSLAPFLLAGEHYYDAQCSTATCGFLEGGLQSESESSFDVPGGALMAHVDADTPDYGRRYFDASPSGGDIYNHLVEAAATAEIEDWVYVTGAGATATLVVQATLAGDLDSPPVPVNAEDWTTPVYGDVRSANPCSDQVLTSNELLRPEGGQSNRVGASLSIASAYQQASGNWLPALHESQSIEVERRSDLEWVEEEGFPGCGGETLEVNGESTGSLASSLTLQMDVPTNQWTRVAASATAEASCLGPFSCDLHAIMPAQLTITSPNGTLVSWHGIAGITSVPEPEHGLVGALGALAWLARGRARRG